MHFPQSYSATQFPEPAVNTNYELRKKNLEIKEEWFCKMFSWVYLFIQLQTYCLMQKHHHLFFPKGRISAKHKSLWGEKKDRGKLRRTPLSFGEGQGVR